MPAPLRPVVIQGGMGVAVSSWQLASAVARTGQLGVVSGTALDIVLARRLQDGDPGGHARRALAGFPRQDVAEWVLERYFSEGGRPAGASYAPVPKLALTGARKARELAVVANFVEVFLAKEDHDGPVGVNYLEKVQLATPFAVLGAMLAGVDYVLMGAGLPRDIPLLLDDLAAGRPGSTRVDVDGSTQEHRLTVDPADWGSHAALRRPEFLAIVSSDTLAAYLAREEQTRPDGYVVEGPTAGGHNAPPRGRLVRDEDGEPVYGPRDQANVDRMVSLGQPFWLAGSYGTPERLAEALARGATGIQVGTAFALCHESGLTTDLRDAALAGIAAGRATVSTDMAASPTGFPFKVVSAPLLPTAGHIQQHRVRLCDLGVLRVPFQRPSGRVGYRCPGEPVDVFIGKGGTVDQTEGVACLCNALFANIGLAQTRPDGYVEPPLLTLGSDLDGAVRLLAAHPGGWSATHVVDWLLASPV
ncbi:nitronate monooxygenase [Acidothermaceae bacterium B102]|nr:nitronate monooxygenase [Acidothermaceae bacterium B102]